MFYTDEKPKQDNINGVGKWNIKLKNSLHQFPKRKFVYRKSQNKTQQNKRILTAPVLH